MALQAVLVIYIVLVVLGVKQNRVAPLVSVTTHPIMHHMFRTYVSWKDQEITVLCLLVQLKYASIQTNAGDYRRFVISYHVHTIKTSPGRQKGRYEP